MKGGLDVLYSGDSNNLEEQEQKQDIVRHHHHFIARKNYDKTIMKKVSSFMTIQQQNQLKQINNISAKNKRIMLVEDEADIDLHDQQDRGDPVDPHHDLAIADRDRPGGFGNHIIAHRLSLLLGWRVPNA